VSELRLLGVSLGDGILSQYYVKSLPSALRIRCEDFAADEIDVEEIYNGLAAWLARKQFDPFRKTQAKAVVSEDLEADQDLEVDPVTAKVVAVGTVVQM
jgi:hypothetical protein